MKNKRGWIKVVEALAAILLIVAVVLIAINQRSIQPENIQARVQVSEGAVLREVQLNSTLREEVVGVAGSNLPVSWDNFDTYAPKTKAKIIEKTPSYLNCTANICYPGTLCLPESSEDSIYVESVIISATIQTYNPRELKLFCILK